MRYFRGGALSVLVLVMSIPLMGEMSRKKPTFPSSPEIKKIKYEIISCKGDHRTGKVTVEILISHNLPADQLIWMFVETENVLSDTSTAHVQGAKKSNMVILGLQEPAAIIVPKNIPTRDFLFLDKITPGTTKIQSAFFRCRYRVFDSNSNFNRLDIEKTDLYICWD